jgi:hypothetical protein
MDEFEKWLATDYKENWHWAYDAGVKAREQGKPRICDLHTKLFITPGNEILKVYKSAWEQGWDGWTIPACFTEMEKLLSNERTYGNS